MAAATTCLELAEGDREEPGGIARTRTEMARRVDRARMLLAKAGGESAASIAARLGVDPNTVKLCVRKYRDGGLGAALADAPRRGRPRSIGDGDRAWVIDVARARPADLGHAAETWTREALARHVRGHAGEAGHPALSGASKATARRMLDAAGPRPDRAACYCERRDPDFGRKTREVLVTYQQLSFRLGEDGNLPPWEEEGPEARVVSVDEKPGTRALSPTGEDPGPTPGVRGGAVTRDHEYRRRGTPALPAGIDPRDGTVEGVARERHGSRELVELPGALDAKYPRGHAMRLVLDNHPVHRPREARAWLEGHPGRSGMVFTPTHGSRPDVIEGFFGKMSRQMPRGIRVESLDELGGRIELYLREVNARPVPHRWTWGIGERAAEAERVMQSS